MARFDYVIVGGGMAAQAAVEGIRSLDTDGSIGWFGAEAHDAYRRPPLSKGLWNGEDEDTIWYEPPGDGVTRFQGEAVIAIDRARREFRTASGKTHTYGRMLLATGGIPRTLPDDDGAVIYFRTLDDYHRVRDLARQQRRFVVIGGGFIGSEVAAALCGEGCAVTMVVPEAGLGGRLFPPELAHFLVEYYRDRGVDVLTNTRVSGVQQLRDRLHVTTNHGGVDGDVVVAGIGIQPNTALAEAAQLAVHDGITVNEYLQTKDEHIFAAGDVANVPVPVLGRRRLEHEDAAVSTGRAAGRNMAGAWEAFDHLPLFYSDLFDLGYEAVGDLDSRFEMIPDWSKPFEEGVVFYVDGPAVRGVLLWNTWGKVEHARDLIRGRSNDRATIGIPSPNLAAHFKGELALPPTDP